MYVRIQNIVHRLIIKVLGCSWVCHIYIYALQLCVLSDHINVPLANLLACVLTLTAVVLSDSVNFAIIMIVNLLTTLLYTRYVCVYIHDRYVYTYVYMCKHIYTHSHAWDTIIVTTFF